jgi:hypothetical protein
MLGILVMPIVCVGSRSTTTTPPVLMWTGSTLYATNLLNTIACDHVQLYTINANSLARFGAGVSLCW